MPFETRFFSVRIDNSGEIVSTYTDKIAAVDEATAIEYAKEIFGQGKSKGFKGNYRYAVSVSDNYTDIIFLDSARSLDTFQSFLQASILISLAGLVLVFILIFIFARIVVKPVAETYEKQKQFITDANHELKTPLTVIGANCDILEMENGENEWTNSIRNQVKNLTDLTNKLVLLSRMDEESVKVNMSEISLSEMVADTANPYLALALSHNKTFETKIENDITVKGDAALLHKLIALLLDNAFKYSDDEGYIELSLALVGKYKLITVTNTTDGVPQKDLNKIFERFYRLDKSRNSETGGHGIGLSVAKAITDLHKGKITVSSPDGKKIIFTVSL